MTEAMPKFAEMPGAPLPVQPPFPFEGMAAKVFPLRASLSTLQRFVDNYLNIGPPEVGRFRVAVPYVYLCVLDYGKMAVEVNNHGWLAQREILFNVAIEWYKVVDGEWQFHDWASVAPFIFVDDDMSMNVGRSVYGWPKTIASMTPTLGDWIKDPQAPVNVATVSTNVFKNLYAGGSLELQPLVEIDRQAPIMNLRVPFDARCALMPWTIASNLAQAASVLTRDALKLLPGLGLMPTQPGTSSGNYATMISKIGSMVFPFRPDTSANTINLKQFRKAENPAEYCYQAITNGPMRFTALDGAGVLGEQHMLMGDLSGGHSIRLYRWPTLPIVETLGIEVEGSWTGPACDVAVLKPVGPFWYKANVVYEPGTTLAWRGEDGVWHDPDNKVPPLEAEGVALSEKAFNTSLGASNRTMAGPFRFAGTTVRVLPLLARREALADFLDGYLNKALADDTSEGEGAPQAPERFELWAANGQFAYVYLTVSSIGSVTSDTDNVGDWTDYELSFLVPVRRESWKNGKREVDVGLVQTFTFSDNATAAAASGEVLGIPTSNAHFIVPEDEWMSYEGPGGSIEQPLLELESQVLPVVGAGQKAVRRSILSIIDGWPPEAEEEAWRMAADRWGSILKTELSRKWEGRARSKDALRRARSLALDFLGYFRPISVYTLKQFRDVAEPDRACYQSLIRVRRTLSEVMDFREIERPLHVRIRDYPTLPIVSQLGLIGQPVGSEGGGVVHVLQPVRPFWLSGTIEEALGEPVLTRGAEGWAPPDSPEAESTKGPIASTLTMLPTEVAGHLLNVGDPRLLARAALRRADGWTDDVVRDFLNGDGDLAPEGDIDPQSVIESLLSREWGNWSADARWQSGHQVMSDRVAKRLRGEAADLLGRRGKQLLAGLKAEQGRLHPWLDGDHINTLAVLMGDFTDLHLHLDRAWSAFTLSMEPGEARRKEEGKRLGDRVPLMKAWGTLLEIARAIAVRDIVDEENESVHARVVLLHELDSQQAIYNAAKDEPSGTQGERARGQRDALMDIVVKARARCRSPLDTILLSLAKAWQKPDYVVARGAVGVDRDRIFPMEHSWDSDWYVGPSPHGDADTTTESGAADGGS